MIWVSMLGRAAEDWTARRKVTNSARTLAFLALAVVFAGCARKTTPEGYRVVSYDNNTKQWTIIRNGTFEGEYRIKRLTNLFAQVHRFRGPHCPPSSGPASSYTRIWPASTSQSRPAIDAV